MQLQVLNLLAAPTKSPRGSTKLPQVQTKQKTFPSHSSEEPLTELNILTTTARGKVSLGPQISAKTDGQRWPCPRGPEEPSSLHGWWNLELVSMVGGIPECVVGPVSRHRGPSTVLWQFFLPIWCEEDLRGLCPMEEMSSEDKMDGAEAKDGTDSQTTKKDVDGTAKEAAFVMGSRSAPPCKTPLICCADGLDQDTFKICKELFRPFKKSLRQLHLPQHLLRKKKLKYLVGSLTTVGGRIDLFVQKYCRASEVQHWQQMLWQFVSLFSEMDAEQLQKLYEHIKNNQMDKFLELRFPSEKSHLVPRLKEEKLEQLYASWGLSRGTSDLQKHLGFQTTSEVIEKSEIN